VCYYFKIDYYVDLTLLSIAIVFPLVFTIRGSFRRREKALEHLSKFRSALKTVHYFINSTNQLPEERKKEMSDILLEISEKAMDHLGNNNENTKDLDLIINQVHTFIQTNDANISRRLRDRIFRFMKDLHESLENLHAINTHRTPISLKAYCKLFIYVFPFIYAPTIISTVGQESAPLITYFVVVLTEFILISLYNIQDQLEYPFDDDGLDDIKINAFKLDR
jgi:predicted membrane chloride channel (bestrophin family)